MGTANKRRPAKQPVAATPQEAGEDMGLEKAGLEKAVEKKPLRPSECKRHLQKTVAAAYRDIVAGFVREAKSGSCQHLKMATEVVEPKAPVKTTRGKGPSQLMLEELESEG